MTVDAATVMSWLIDHSVRVAALMVMVGAGSLLARKASAHGRMFAWTVVLYLAAAMPLLAAVLPDVPVPVFSAPVILVSNVDSGASEPVAQAGTGLASSQSPSALPWLLAGYLAVAGFLFTRLIAGIHQTTRVLRRSRVAIDATLVAELQTLSSAMQLPRVPRVVEHESVRVPFVCGLFRPALVLPDSWTSWDAATRRAVLTHELSHIVRRDLWTMRMAALYRTVTWINPASWWLRRRLETLAERASDEAVLASGVDATAYAEILVQFFAAAQRAPGRARWQLAMARRGGLEAQRRLGRVLNAPEGGNVRFGMLGRVLVGMVVVLAAVPAMVLSASRLDAVSIQPPPVIDRGLENQAAPRILQAEPVTVVLSPQPVHRVKVEIPLVKMELPIVIARVNAVPQEQEQEPEPWRSTRNGSDAGVATPTLSYGPAPKYTSDAMRAKIQGWVTVEVIVSPEGNVTAARVIKSLDRVFGLDEEALKAARQWTFRPGTYQGQPTALRCIIEMQFTLRR